MLRRQVLGLLAALALVAGLGYGTYRLFALRMEEGDVFPMYSTLRMDPLGASALYEAFAASPNLQVRRNYQTLPKLQPPGPVTLFYTGLPHTAMWEPNELPAFEALVVDGSRAVLTMWPTRYSETAKEKKNKEASDKDAAAKKSEAAQKDSGEKEQAKDDAGKEKSDKTQDKDGKDKKAEGKKSKDRKSKDKTTDDKKSDDDDDEEAFPKVKMQKVEDTAKKWGFEFAYTESAKEDVFKGTAKREGDRDLEPEIPWHSTTYFKITKPDWHTLYTCNGHPVVIERKLGAGSLLIASDSYFISNEALRSDRCPKLLAALVGPADLVFDEHSHNVTEEPNMAGLVKRYGLRGAVAALFLVAALFVWRNIVRFVPPYSTAAESDVILSGQESTEGFVNLLRRSVSPKKLLGVCIAEWRKSYGHDARELAKLEVAAMAAAGSDPVTGYSALAARLTRKHPHLQSPTAKPL